MPVPCAVPSPGLPLPVPTAPLSLVASPHPGGSQLCLRPHPQGQGRPGGVQGGRSCPSPALCTSLGRVATPGRRWHGAAPLQDRAQLHPLPCPAEPCPAHRSGCAAAGGAIRALCPCRGRGDKGTVPPSGHRDLPQPEPGLLVRPCLFWCEIKAAGSWNSGVVDLGGGVCAGAGAAPPWSGGAPVPSGSGDVPIQPSPPNLVKPRSRFLLQKSHFYCAKGQGEGRL